MEVKYLGEASFKIKAKKGNGLALTVSCQDGESKVEIVKTVDEREETMVFERVGEYEVGGVGVVGLRTETNIIFVVHIEEIAVLYLGEFGGSLTEKQTDNIGPVDILLTRPKATKLIKELSPAIAVPFGTEGEIDNLLEKMSLTLNKQEKLSLSKEDLPEETSVIVLG